MRKGMAGDMKSTYAAAVTDYKAGNYPAAKQKFALLEAQGYKAALFQRSPDDYLKDIARRMPAEANPQNNLVMPGDNNLTPPVAAPKTEVAGSAPAAAPAAAAAAATPPGRA